MPDTVSVSFHQGSNLPLPTKLLSYVITGCRAPSHLSYATCAPLKRAGQAQLTLLPLVPLSSLLPCPHCLSARLSLSCPHSELASRSFTLLVPPKTSCMNSVCLVTYLGRARQKVPTSPFFFILSLSLIRVMTLAI